MGATITTVIMVFMLIYASFQLETMFKRERTTVNIKTVYEDLNTHYNNYSLDAFGFDFALQLSLFGEPVYDERYYGYEVENVNSFWAPDKNGIIKRAKTSKDLKMAPCKQFNASDAEVTRLGINQSYYCPQIKDYAIGGAFSSPNYRYLYVKVVKCDGKKNPSCKTDTEIDKYLDQAQVNMFYTNFYFDSDDYEQPIKRFIDDKIWFKIMPKFRLDADMFVRRNYLKLQDDYVQITGEKEGMFISISGQRETIDDYEVGDQKLVRIYFRIDPVVEYYERQIYSTGDLLAQVGGIFSFLKTIGAVLVFIFSERLLVAALAGKLYQVYDEKKAEDRYNGPDMSSDYDPVNSSIYSNKLNRSSNKVHNISVEPEENAFFSANPIRNLFKSTLYCKSKSGSIVKKLRENKELDEVDRLKIKKLVLSRKRFNYNTCHIFEYLL
jgi:hypothetical protein